MSAAFVRKVGSLSLQMLLLCGRSSRKTRDIYRAQVGYTIEFQGNVITFIFLTSVVAIQKE